MDFESNNNMELDFKKSKISSLSCGGRFSSILSNGKVYSTGINQFSQLGLGDTNNRSFFTLVKLPKTIKITQISCGFNHQLFLSSSGDVYAVGKNECGQLGIGNEIEQSIPAKTNKLPKIKKLIASCDNSYFLDFNGNVYSSGHNNFGQLGLGDNNNRNIPCKIKFPNNIKIEEIYSNPNFITYFFQNKNE